MTRPLDYLYFDDGHSPREIFNGARTMAYLANYSCNLFTQKTAPCGILSLDPCTEAALDFSSTTTAPWYDGVPGSPSSNGYGFWITEWTGMDGSNIRRAATNLYPRGAAFGPLGQAHRIWKMNVMLFGADEVALEDLFRWLEESLLACCQPGVTAWVRTTCPDGYDDDYGLVHVVDLQLLEGVSWISDPAEGYGCTVREVSFTLGVGDPCLYGPPEMCVEDEPFPTGSVIVTGDGAAVSAATGTWEMPATTTSQVIIEWEGALDDYTPSSVMALISHTAASPELGWELCVNTVGELRFLNNMTGSAVSVLVDSDTPISSVVSNGDPIRVRVLHTTTTGDVYFWYSFDHGASWTQLGDVVPSASGFIWNANATTRIGLGQTGAALAGYTNHATVRSVLTEPLHLEFQPGDEVGGTWIDPYSGQTWTIGAGGDVVASTEIDLCEIGLEAMFGCEEDPDAMADWRICCPVLGRRIGVTAPVVILHNNSVDEFSPPVRVLGVTDFFDNECVVGTNAIFGEVRVAGIPPQSEIMVDCARRRVLWRQLGFLRAWQSGYVYLDRSLTAIPDYPANGCDDGLIFVEPIVVTESLADLTVTVHLVSRYGCC